MADNIKYVELRTGFQEFKDWSNSEEIKNSIVFLRPGFRMEDYFHHADMMVNVTPHEPDTKFLKMILKAKNEADEDLEVKVILTANRNKTMVDLTETCKKIDTAIAIKNGIGAGKDETAIADMIIGFDFVNQEFQQTGLTDMLHTILYNKFHHYGKLQKETTKLKLLMTKERIDLIRFFLHDGESVDSIRNTNSNAITGPICSRHRIGHGFQMGTDQNLNGGLMGNDVKNYILNGNKDDVELRVQNGSLPKYPIYANIDTDKKTLQYERNDSITEPVLELCPISNYMLRYVDELEKHPAISLMEQGIPAVICSDDPQIFGSKGLTHDYALMHVALINHFKASATAAKDAYDYLKISSFLGYFYQEMSKNYYMSTEEGVQVVNDQMTVAEENQIFEKAQTSFIHAWNIFIGPYKNKQSTLQGTNS